MRLDDNRVSQSHDNEQDGDRLNCSDETPRRLNRRRFFSGVASALGAGLVLNQVSARGETAANTSGFRPATGHQPDQLDRSPDYDAGRPAEGETVDVRPILTMGELVEHLQWAVELEHSSIPPYLCALYTIADGANEEASKIIRSVVMEEMLHMTLAANVLNAVGGSPIINHPRFMPSYPAFLPDGERDFEVSLLNFSPGAIEMFLRIERPSERAIKPAALRRRTSRTGLMAMGNRHLTVGDFYQAIKDGLRRLVAETGESNVFRGDLGRQVAPDAYYSGGGRVIKVHDLQTAEAALSVITDQGEGAPNSIFDGDHQLFGQPREVAHYFRFQQILLGRYYRPGDKPDRPTGKPLDVDWNAVYHMCPNPRASHYPAGSEARKRSEEFNRTYTKFLMMLDAAFNGKPDLLTGSAQAMKELKYAALDVIRCPLSSKNELSAGPAFEYAD